MTKWRAGCMRAGGWAAALAVAVALAASTGCIERLPKVQGAPGVAPSPDVPWTPPPPREKAKPVTPAEGPAIPPHLLESVKNWSLLDVVDIALRNSPETRAAWAEARSQAAALGSEKGAYYPQVDLEAAKTRIKGSAVGGLFSFHQRTVTTTADLSVLLFDFGGRKASVDEARQSLIAANWTQNAAIQDVVLLVEQTYYQYVTVKALLEAQEAALKEARANLDAAEVRHKAGVATIADVLQARTAASQAELALIKLSGQRQVTRGVLATAMGIPADTPFDVEIPEITLPTKETSALVDHYLEVARTKRPDLAAARARAERARAHLRKIRAEGYPALTADGSLARIYYGGAPNPSDTYNMSLRLSFPLFTGFSHHYDVLEAEADADTEKANLQRQEQAVILDVWTGYYNFKTAEQQVRTAEELLKSATESHDVALGRYKAGVGSILDLLAAQNALEGARAQRVLAWSDWFLSVAELAHATGTLELTDHTPPPGAPTGGELELKKEANP